MKLSMPSDLSPEAVQRGLGTVVVGRSVHFYTTVKSTQDMAQAAGRAAAPNGAVFIADHQTSGRGRLGRIWQAPPGGSLLLSVLLRPSPPVYPILSMAGALATCLAIEEAANLSPRLKWPNDILLRGKKVAGVLVEGEVVGGTPDFAVLGVGINVTVDPASLEGLAYPATSLGAETGRIVSRGNLARALLCHLDRLYLEAASGGSPYFAWRERLATLGHAVRVDTGTEVEEGIAEDVDETGALLVRRADGRLIVCLAGEATLQGLAE